MEDKNPSKKFYKRWWFWVLAVFVFLMIIGSSNAPKNTGSNTATSTAPQESAIPVTATQVMSDYSANEVAADAQYKGKLVEVSGTITTIGKDILDTPYIALSTGGNSFFSIQCMFEKSDQAQLATLSKDTRIILRGRVSGKLGNIIIRECSVVK
jgi:hypothetical protein